ncbi:5-formyltetrahydrofolate cyclo-ligase [Paenibacillus herberti]|nr:5-formyltetrahydrofolate cyclo-ligase [Paenibacillus herberti]
MSESSPAGQKKMLRQRLLGERDAMPPELRNRASLEACRYASQWITAQGIDCLMAYVSFRSELDTSQLLIQCWSEGRKVLLPRVRREDGSMELYSVRSRDELVSGAYGILEPDPVLAEPAGSSMPQAVFVPGAAFDRRGGRLGYGGGYYDRFREASMVRPGDTPLWIGLGFSSQLVPEVPMEPHDAALDGMVTELGLNWTQSHV